MKFFVDTGDFKEIEDLSQTGLLDGVTTNPSLVAKSGRNFKELIAEICKVVPGPVSAEVASIITLSPEWLTLMSTESPSSAFLNRSIGPSTSIRHLDFTHCLPRSKGLLGACLREGGGRDIPL